MKQINNLRVSKALRNLTSLISLIKLLIAKSALNAQDKQDLGNQLTTISGKWVKIGRSKGFDHLLKVIKVSRLLYLRNLAGEPYQLTSEDPWVSLDSEGLPKILGPFRKKDPNIIRFTLTVLYASRWIPWEGVADYSTINGRTRAELHPDFIHFLDHNCHTVISKFQKSFWPESPTFHNTTKMGPNGPALLTSIYDLRSIGPEYCKILLDWLKLFPNDHYSYRYIVELLKMNENASLPEEVSYVRDRSKRCSRRLQEIDDKEGKRRIIAMGDYWTQLVMKPLHTELNTVLQWFHEDCTFNQSHFQDLLVHAGKEVFYSIDLKAATDLMPVNYQAEVLNRLWKQKGGDLWLKIMGEQEWESPKGKIRFTAGQPMGLYSSWPMMAITHHFLVRWAFQRCRQSWKGKYALLGDDLLIVGETAYESYREVLSITGMEINQSKTFKSKILFEFAKRYFYNGEEVSPFPLGSIVSSHGDLAGMAVGIDNAITKSWSNPLKLQEDAARRDLFRSLGSRVGVPKTFIYRFPERLSETLGMMSLVRWATHSDQPTCFPKEGVWAWNKMCGSSQESTRKHVRYLLTTIFLKTAKELSSKNLSVNREATKKFKERFSLETRILPLDRHPIEHVAKESYMTNVETTMEVLDEVNVGSSITDSMIDRLLNLSIVEPISMEPYLNQRKGSVRKAQVLSRSIREFQQASRGDKAYLDALIAFGLVEGLDDELDSSEYA